MNRLAYKSHYKIVIHSERLGGVTSQAHKVMVDGDNLSDLSFFQTTVDITQVDVPSSIMHQEMMALQTLTGIWKATDEGNGGCSYVSTGKTIK